ncbi:MAG TPA: SOS response-associated peptidase [Candidatus Limnocylindrales bacterium]|nr:SOS response-associated peptidase [Candidatus Limnocylindrales bacterium]
MCGRFAQQRPASELAEIFGAEPLDDLDARFNVAPTDPALVVAQRDERRAIVAWSWGLVPHWTVAGAANAGPRRQPPFNARAETLERSPLFREAFQRRRCIVPVDAFYEWRRSEGSRVPHAIRRADGRPLALAGLWAGARLPSGEIHRTFTIVTTRPNETMAPLHDRMPVVLPDDAWERWLDVRRPADGELRALLEPDDSVALAIYPVAPLVNNVRNDGPELLAPLVGA